MSKVYTRILFDLFAARCPSCRQPLAGSTGLCRSCRQRLAALAPDALCRCGLPHRGGWALTAAPAPAPGSQSAPWCQRCPSPPFTLVRSALVYRFPLDRLLQRYKQHQQLSAEPALEQAWREALRRWPVPSGAQLVPMPQHWRRSVRRGFHPAARLAAWAAAEHSLPVCAALLLRRPLAIQHRLNRARRQQNLAGALALRRSLSGPVILVDDVVTTGASARAGAEVLRRGGATSVTVWCLARTL